MIEAAQVVALYHTRKNRRSPMLEKRLEVLNQYNGETRVVLPELDQTNKPSVANLLNLGLDQFAQRIASQMPDVNYPSLRPGVVAWDDKARMSRMANLGWWDMNRMQLLDYKRARFLLAFAGAPVTIHPVSQSRADKRKIPHWRVRSPLNCFPAVPDDSLDYEPTDYIVRHEYSLSWLTDRYPGPMSTLFRNKSDNAPDTMFEVLEYNDADETVLVACGSKPEKQDGYGWQEERSEGSAQSVVLERTPNRAGMCLMVWPGRITLDKPIGHFDTMLHLFTSQAKMAAYEELSMFKSIFPEQWIQSHPAAPSRPKITRDADAKNGVIGVIENGVLTTIPLNPGAQVPTAIDRLERASRLAGGIPAEFGGESPTNVRTARRGADVLGQGVDMPLQEYQAILAAGKDAENVRAVKVMKSYYGKMVSMYHVPRDGKVSAIFGSPKTYKPDDVFVSDFSITQYSFPGSDAAQIPIELSQRVGTGEMSLQTAREKDPVIDDPIEENTRVELEGLRKAMLAGLEQQLSAGGLDPVVVAKIAQAKAEDPGAHLEDIYVKVHEAMQKEQAAQAAAQPQPPPGAGPPGQVPGAGGPQGAGGPPPGSMPGAAMPPGGQATIPQAPQGQLNLQQILGSLKPAGAGAPS